MKPTVSGIIALLFFSTGGLLVALTDFMPGLQLAGMALILGSLCLAAYLKIFGQNLRVGFQQPLKSYLFVIVGIGVYTALFYMAMGMAPPFEINMLNYLWPILLALFSAKFQKHTLALHHLVGIALGFVGTVLIFQPGSDQALFKNFGLGHALMIAGAFIWAIYSASIKGKQYPAAMIVPAMFLSGVLCGILHFFLEETRTQISAQAWCAIILLGLTRASFVLWDYGMKYGNSLVLASLSYFVPLFSAALFILFGFKPASLWVTYGGFLILCGCLIVNMPGIEKFLRSFKSPKL